MVGQPCRLEVQHLRCFHGAQEVIAGISLCLEPGQNIALIGANGSGKTTFIRAVLGFHSAASGQVLLDGKSTAAFPANPQHYRRIAWIPQRQPQGAFPLLVQELLAGKPPEALEVARQLGLEALLNRPLHGLSGGQLQRAFVARAVGAVAGGAGLVLADEPTAALDFEARQLVADTLLALKCTLLLVTHDLSLAERCGRVAEMAAGQLRELR